MAQIVALVDAYDALTTDRPYRKALTPEVACSILQKETAEGCWNPQLTSDLGEIID